MLDSLYDKIGYNLKFKRAFRFVVVNILCPSAVTHYNRNSTTYHHHSRQNPDGRVVCQVIPGHGNPQKRRTMFAGIDSNIVALIARLFTRYGIPVKRLTPKSYLKSYLDVSNSHKTSANLSVRANFRQFSDW